MTQSSFKILITGAGGMLGTDLVKALEADFEVVGLDKRPAPHLGRHIEICDLLQERKLHEIFVSLKPDLMIHCAAMTDVDYCEEHHDEALAQNLEATKNLVALANETDIPLIFFSTDYVFDGKKLGAYTEADPGNPVSFYGKTKWEAEEYIRANAKRAVIFRISWLYGVYGRSFPKAILRQASEVKKLNVVGDQTGCPTYTRDVADAIATVLKSKKEAVFENGIRVFHLSNHGKTTWAGFARFITKTAGLKDVSVEDITTAQLNRPAPRPENSVLSLKKTESDLGLHLRSWQEAMPDFLNELDAVKKAAELKAQKEAEAAGNSPE